VQCAATHGGGESQRVEEWKGSKECQRAAAMWALWGGEGTWGGEYGGGGEVSVKYVGLVLCRGQSSVWV